MKKEITQQVKGRGYKGSSPLRRSESGKSWSDWKEEPRRSNGKSYSPLRDKSESKSVKFYD